MVTVIFGFRVVIGATVSPSGLSAAVSLAVLTSHHNKSYGSSGGTQAIFGEIKLLVVLAGLQLQKLANREGCSCHTNDEVNALPKADTFGEITELGPKGLVTVVVRIGNARRWPLVWWLILCVVCCEWAEEVWLAHRCDLFVTIL